MSLVHLPEETAIYVVPNQLENSRQLQDSCLKWMILFVAESQVPKEGIHSHHVSCGS